MQLKIKTSDIAPEYSIEGEIINGFDLSAFPEGATFSGNEETLSAGIYDVERVDGVLHVTIGQNCIGYECQPTGGSHDWRGTGEWINAADYDPGRCYIVAISAPEGAEYVRRDNGWTVVLQQSEIVEEEDIA